MSARTVRITVVDEERTVSFVAPAHALKMAAAACARDPKSIAEFVAGLGNFDPDLAASLSSGLSGSGGIGMQVVTVRDDQTRGESLEPAGAGVVVFNLPARRIVQLRNDVAEIQRADRGRMRRNGRPVQLFYHYDLPPEWAIVP